jgi:putative spermidine/putrescine transport system ATP-binding protein
MEAVVAEPALRLRAVEKHYGATHAVAGVDLDVAEGEFVTLLGPSGCGKSTTLGLIAGFFPTSRGEIRLRGRSVENLPPFKRDIGVVFQDYALFPHMTVAQNVAFGLRMRHVPRAEIEKRVAEALELVKLGHLGERRPVEISGGQRQRVALARALVIRPTILLLDEPLSNLDLKLREEMRLEIASLQRRVGITTIFVTHDQSEALVMSDRVAVMNAGRIEQVGTPSDIYERPRTRFVAEFIGRMNFLRGEVVVAGEGARVRVPHAGDLALDVPESLGPGTPVYVAVRPERARIAATQPSGSGSLALRATVRNVLYLGAVREIHLVLPDGQQGVVELPNSGDAPALAAGEKTWFTARASDCLVLRTGVSSA